MAKKPDKENDSDDFDSWFSNMIDSQMKEASKKVKKFKGTVHNYTTGVIPLDYAINPENPGIPGGTVVQFAGQGGSGKTTLALNIAQDHMDQGYHVLYCDPENGLKDSMIEGFGYPKHGHPLFTYVQYQDDGIEPGPAVHYFATIKKTLQGLQGKDTPFIIIVDSVSYLRPTTDSYSVKVGDNIQFFNTFLRQVAGLIGNTNALLILINGVYIDNANKYNDYIIPGGETLRRVSDLITVHYKRANDTSNTCPAHEKSTIEVTKNFTISYRQKLGIKLFKNKLYQTEIKNSAMDYFFANNKTVGRYHLDNSHAMLMFLKDNGVLYAKGAPGSYQLGETNMYWKDWEHNVNNNPEINRMVISKTLESLNAFYKGETL